MANVFAKGLLLSVTIGLLAACNDPDTRPQIDIEGKTMGTFYSVKVSGDVAVNKQQLQQQIDAVLEKQGSNKSSILDATIFLADKNDFAAMNKAWDAWVVAGHAPVRCTVQAGLMNPKYKVEIKIVAAV